MVGSGGAITAGGRGRPQKAPAGGDHSWGWGGRHASAPPGTVRPSQLRPRLLRGPSQDQLDSGRGGGLSEGRSLSSAQGRALPDHAWRGRGTCGSKLWWALRPVRRGWRGHWGRKGEAPKPPQLSQGPGATRPLPRPRLSQSTGPASPRLPIQKQPFQGVNFRLELIDILGLQDPVGGGGGLQVKTRGNKDQSGTLTPIPPVELGGWGTGQGWAWETPGMSGGPASEVLPLPLQGSACLGVCLMTILRNHDMYSGEEMVI